MKSRILIDANVLLHAIFLEDSIARRTVTGLTSRGHSVYCDEIVHFEASRRLERARRLLHLNYDLDGLFSDLLKTLGVLFLPPGDPAIPSIVHRHDRHIPRAAATFGASIITDDAELYISLAGAGYEVANSFEVLLGLKDQSTQRGVLWPRINPLNGRLGRGWVMAWATPGEWATSTSKSWHTVFDFPAFVWVFYDNLKKEWVARFRFCEHLIRLAYDLMPGSSVAVAVTYDGAQTPQKFALCVGSPSGARLAKVSTASVALPNIGSAGWSCGHIHQQTGDGETYHWYGHMRTLQIGDRYIGKTLWKRVSARQDMMLHPELDILDPALVAIGRLLPLGHRTARLSEL